MKRTIALALLMLGACQSPMIWDKPDGNQSEFNKDDYACRKDAIAYGGATMNAYGINPTPNREMYQRCMMAAGYSMR